MPIYCVRVASVFHEGLSYTHAEPLEKGQIVCVHVRSKPYLGIIDDGASSYQGKCRPIVDVCDYKLPINIMEFIKKMAHYIMAPYGLVLKQVLSAKASDLTKEKLSASQNSFNFCLKTLTPEQELISNSITQGQFQATLLDGVTGSGKTEIYFDVIKKMLLVGKQALVLLPEIALTTQLLARFEEAFGTQACVWHSRNRAKRFNTWSLALRGDPLVVIGARSALFLPFSNLGCIIIDEEHDPSFKQDEQLIFHARDMAILKAKIENIPIILGSATPSLETYYHAKTGKYQHALLTTRFKATLPITRLVNAPPKDAKEMMGPELQGEITKRLVRNEQTLLYLNRRGFAPLVICRGCFIRLQCPNCATFLVFHKAQNRLKCHYCSHQKNYPPFCKTCQSEESFFWIGPGVEQIKEEVSKIFPNARTLIATSDHIKTPKDMEKLAKCILKKECDIIIATQILAKGHHFPDITLVGVVNGDLGLSGVDFRGFEKAYHLLQQVSGRCGRAEKKGLVIVQTDQPKHALFKALETNDRDLFYDHELNIRKNAHLPPYTRLTLLTLKGRDAMLTKHASFDMVAHLPTHPDVSVMGPTEAAISPLRSYYRCNILLRYPKAFGIQQYLKHAMTHYKKTPGVDLVIDIDPINFL